MLRQKRLAVVSHCVLNQNTVVHPMARAAGGFPHVIHELINKQLGIYQLPCPEMRFCGMHRLPQNHKQYDLPAYHDLCRRLAQQAIEDLENLHSIGCKAHWVVGIGCSPTCSILHPPVGHLFHYLRPQLEKLFPTCQYTDISPDYQEDCPFSLPNV